MTKKEPEIIGHLEWKIGETTKSVIIVVCIHGSKYGYAQWYYSPNEDYVKNKSYRRVYYPVPTDITKAQAYDIINGKMMIKLRKSEGGFVDDAELDEYIAKARENIDLVAQRRQLVRKAVFEDVEKERLTFGKRIFKGSCRNQIINVDVTGARGRTCKQCYRDGIACQPLMDKIMEADNKDMETKAIKDEYKALNLKEKLDVKKGISGLKYTSPEIFHREVKE